MKISDNISKYDKASKTLNDILNTYGDLEYLKEQDQIEYIDGEFNGTCLISKNLKHSNKFKEFRYFHQSGKIIGRFAFSFYKEKEKYTIVSKDINLFKINFICCYDCSRLDLKTNIIYCYAFDKKINSLNLNQKTISKAYSKIIKYISENDVQKSVKLPKKIKNLMALS